MSWMQRLQRVFHVDIERCGCVLLKLGYRILDTPARYRREPVRRHIGLESVGEAWLTA